jgi:hypothetical protein
MQQQDSVKYPTPVSYSSPTEESYNNETTQLLSQQQELALSRKAYFTFKHMLLTVCSNHLFLSICVRKNKDKDTYSTFRRLVFALFCVLCSLLFLIFTKQISMTYDILCKDSRDCYTSCLHDYPVVPGVNRTECLVNELFILRTDRSKGIFGKVYAFHYEDSKSDMFQKCTKNKYCTSYCKDTISQPDIDTRPLCSDTPEALKKDLWCIDGELYCQRASFPLFGALMSGLLAFLCFYPSKFLLSCTLKVTSKDRCCDSMVGKIWTVAVFLYLIFVVVVWILLDVAMISYANVFFGGYFKQFIWILYPFALSMISGFVVDFVVQVVLYFACLKWRAEDNTW